MTNTWYKNEETVLNPPPWISKCASQSLYGPHATGTQSPYSP